MNGFDFEAHGSIIFEQDLSHHYSQMSPESKLELHIYSTVLLYCLQRSSVPKIQLNGSSLAQIGWLSFSMGMQHKFLVPNSY